MKAASTSARSTLPALRPMRRWVSDHDITTRCRDQHGGISLHQLQTAESSSVHIIRNGVGNVYTLSGRFLNLWLSEENKLVRLLSRWRADRLPRQTCSLRKDQCRPNRRFSLKQTMNLNLHFSQLSYLDSIVEPSAFLEAPDSEAAIMVLALEK